MTKEVAPGVFLALNALPGGGFALQRVRFAKHMFSSGEAEAWWLAHRDAVYTTYGLQPASPQSQTLQYTQQVQKEHQLHTAWRADLASSRRLVSVLNPHPLGQPAAAAVARGSLGGLAELHIKRYL